MSGPSLLWVRRFPGDPPPLVALHGFTQNGATFAELAGLLGCEVIAPDLPGHGRSTGVPATFESATLGTAEVLDRAGGPLPLLGYSMGGRIALAVAAARPELVSRLVVVSAGSGIEDSAERAARRAEDEKLASRLERDGLPAFLDEWLERPMFAGLRRREPGWRVADRRLRERNTVAGLAAALRGMGPGAQPFLGNLLSELPMPVLLVVGELDERYRAIAEDTLAELRMGQMGVVAGAGHAVVAEAPADLASRISAFLGSGSGA